VTPSVVLDHFGVFGLPRHPAGIARVLGGALLIAGVALMRR
jgi:transporter family-2 protein